jgi:hypothetical protein
MSGAFRPPARLARAAIGLVKLFFAENDRPPARSGVATLFATAVMTLALCNCSGSPFIGMYAADYKHAEAYSGDAQLLQNILRAKDNLPIHFADLSVIHGSLQLTSGVTAAIPTSGSPTIVTPALGAQSSPTFDVGTLDTKDFTVGLLTPVKPQIVKQLFDQGVDPRLIMLLFFAEYHAGSQRYLNNMSCDPSKPIRPSDHECYLEIFHYLNGVNSLFYDHGIQTRRLRANIYVALTPIGGPLTSLAGAFGDLRQLDTSKFKLIGNRLYAISEQRLAICYQTEGGSRPLFTSAAGNRACESDEVIVPSGARSGTDLPLRSTYQIIQFLGQILRYQEEHGGNRCITLGLSKGRECDTGEVFFQVNAPVGTPVVVTQHGGYRYGLHERSCVKIQDQACDYSLQVLAIVELLLNANKSAGDIIATPRVSVVR